MMDQVSTMSKKEFKENAKQTIDKIFSEIEVLENKKDQLTDQAKQEAEKMLSNLKTKKSELTEKYKAIETATDEKWSEAKDSFTQSAGSFKEGLKKMASMIN
jgi:SMC interacting uncharacterized protein involved in chromosome segregation